VRKDVHEQRRDDGVILRRTTIEEIELPKKSNAANAHEDSGQSA
jgi:hypothetical protein